LITTNQSAEGDEMPQILVVADVENDVPGEVVYRERISPSDLQSDHFSGQLVERVGWAVRDADEAEHRRDPLGKGSRGQDGASA
jgi:hypothetical protein